MLNRNPINGRFISGSNAAGAGNSAGSSSGSLPDWFDRFLGNSTAGASSAIQNSTRALVSAFAFLVGAIWSGGGRLIGAFGTVALFLTGALLGGLGAFVGGVRSIVSEATGLARNLALIRAQTGYSFSQGYGITSRFQLAGISPQTTTGLLSNPAMNPLLARIRGVDLQNPDFLPQMAGQYQGLANQGPFGRMLANQRLRFQFGGNVPDEVLLAANMSPRNLRSQAAFGERTNASLGLNPALLSRYSEEVPLLTNRIGYLVSSIKLRLAGDLLPVLERSLGRAADFIGRNAGKIADALESGLNWLFTEAPPLAMRFAAAMLRAFGSLLDGISSLAGGLSQNLPALLTGLDIFLNALGQIPAFVVGVGAAIMQGASNLWEEFRSSVVGRLVLPRSSSDAAPATTPETTPVERRRAAIAGVMGMPGMELPGLSHRMGLAGTDSALPSARSGGRSSALADFFKYVGGGAALGAGVGFGVGSIVPGIGNVTGAGVGAGVGAVAGFSYWFGKHVLHRLAAPDAGRGLLPGSPLPAGSERSVRDVFFAQPGRTATDAYFDAFNAMHGKTGNWAMSKDAGLQARLSGFLQSVEKNAGAGSKWAFGAADSLDKAATDYAKQAAISERNARAAERTANATERIAASNQGLLQNFGAMAQGMIVTVAAQITEDMVSAAYRNG